MNRLAVLHGGALGDLVLTIHVALRLLRSARHESVHLISRTDPGDLSACTPPITRRAAEGLGLHWLYARDDAVPPVELRELVHGAHVLNALSDTNSAVHQRLATLAPARLLSFDPRPRPGLQRHITQQWQTDLEAQGLLLPKCVHQWSMQRSLGVPDSLRTRGCQVLRAAGCDAGCCLIHPGSGGTWKCWPLSSFVEVGRRLAAARHDVCFLLGPVEVETWRSDELRALADEFPTLRLPDADALAAAVAAAQVLIASDSGPAHLAALLGTRTVVIFGPTAPVVWRPLGRDVRVLVGNPNVDAKHWAIDPDSVMREALCGLCP